MALIIVTAPDGTTSQVESNEALLVHGLDGSGNYLGLVAPGSAVAFAPTAPPPEGVWQFLSGEWQRVYTLPELREVKWEQIKDRRSIEDFAGFVWSGSRFDSDTLSQTRIMSSVQVATGEIIAPSLAGFSKVWTLSNNTTRVLNAADMAAVGAALDKHLTSNHDVSQVIRAEIDAAGSEAAVNAIKWRAPLTAALAARSTLTATLT